MKYKNLRESKIKGGIGFSYTKDILSGFIRFFRNGAKYTHTFVVVSDETDKRFIQHAIPSGVKITTMNEYLKKNAMFEIFMPTTGDIDEAIKKISGLVGKQYGFFQVVGFAFMWLLHKIGLRKFNPFERGVICSEMVWKYVLALGSGHIMGSDWEKLDKDEIAPDELYEKISKGDGLFRIAARKKLGETEVNLFGEQ